MIAKRTTMMKQPGLGLNLSTKLTRKRELLDEMKWVVPWAALVAVIGKNRCTTFRCTASLQVWATARCACPDESTILRFRHLLEANDLARDILRVVNDILQANGLLLRAGTAVDATLIAAPSSTKNASGECDLDMKQTKKGNNWYFRMKAHIGADADSGLVHTGRPT